MHYIEISIAEFRKVSQSFTKFQFKLVSNWSFIELLKFHRTFMNLHLNLFFWKMLWSFTWGYIETLAKFRISFNWSFNESSNWHFTKITQKRKGKRRKKNQKIVPKEAKTKTDKTQAEKANQVKQNKTGYLKRYTGNDKLLENMIKCNKILFFFWNKIKSHVEKFVS